MLKSKFELNFDQVYVDAQTDGVDEQLEDELASFAELLRDHYDFKLFLEDPRVAAAEKKKYLKKMLPANISRNFISVLHVLIDNGREELLTPLSLDFTSKLAADKNIAFGRVASVVPVPEKMRHQLEQMIRNWQNKPVRLRYDIDPDLLGGLRLRFIDGTVWDLSLKHKLMDCREAILA